MTDRGEPIALGLDDLVLPVGALASPVVVDLDRRRRGWPVLDVVPGRSAVEPCRWLAERGDAWLGNIRWATLDLSGPYRAVFDTMLPDATQIADPFHLVKLAN